MERAFGRTITLEEHYASPTFMQGAMQANREMSASPSPQMEYFAKLGKSLTDIGDGRIAEMDEAGIDVQILSLTAPGVEQLSPDDSQRLARASNDALANAVRQHPNRFYGFAALSTPAPEKAAEELERTVRQYGFKGALINGHSRGRYLDDSFFWPIFAKAEALGVPIYLHPTLPTQAVVQAYYQGNFPDTTKNPGGFSGAAWGWHIETAVHVIRLILSGVLDKYPKLQLVVGHLGEGLPFFMERLNRVLTIEVTKLDRPFASYLRENVHYTISGFNFVQPFLDLLLQVGIDRIMFSADYPYASMSEAVAFLYQLPLSPEDKQRVAHGNAELLFRL